MYLFENFVVVETMQHYIYDAACERTLKASSHLEQVYENGQLVDGNGVNFDTYTTYASPYLVIDANQRYSKHYYFGAQRIVSKLGEESIEIFDAPSPKLDALRQLQIADLKKILDKAKKDTPSFTEYKIAEDSTKNTQARADQVGIYFFHPDHLGSSTFLTDGLGNPYQFFINLPFGESMYEQHSYSEDYVNPFKFNGKELDVETNLYYYGARYYDPSTSIWLSVDPLADFLPAHSPYNFSFNNPVYYIDANGKIPTPYEAALMAADVYGDSKYGLTGGWKRSSVYGFDKDKTNGLKAAMYERKKDDGSLEYAYVYAGTDGGNDVDDDLAQVFALSEQYDETAILSLDIDTYLGSGNELTFVGHSLGGGLSNLSALKTGRSSITFNPAWLSKLNIGKTAKLKEGNSINNYVHQNDPLHLLQQPGRAFGVLKLSPTGKTNYVFGGFNPLKNNLLTGHFIGTMIERLKSKVGKPSGSEIRRSPRYY